MTKRVAWLLRGDGAGLLIKSSGENVVLWARLRTIRRRACASLPGRPLYKILGDAGPGGGNTPGWADNGCRVRRLRASRLSIRVALIAVAAGLRRGLAAERVQQPAGQVADDAERDKQHRQRKRRRGRDAGARRRTRRTPPGWCRCR